MRSRRRWLPAFAGMTMLTACTVGPDYQRPVTDLPPAFPISGETVPVSAEWWNAFDDPLLSLMIGEALAYNDDIAAAAARLDEARGQLGYAQANRLPEVDLNASVVRQKVSQALYGNFGPGGQGGATGGSSLYSGKSTIYALPANLNFDLDLWGRLRRADEAARAQLLSSEAARQTVLLEVETDVAADYVNLLNLDKQIAITNDTITSRRNALGIQQKRFEAGTVSPLDFRQAESELSSAEEQLPTLQQQLAAQENALSVLLGKSPRVIIESVPARDRTIDQLPVPPAIPTLLPSDLLERRPDIRQAEGQLIAANAEIGVAKAAYFPDLSLTGLLGLSSLQFDRLFHHDAEETQIGGSLVGPILDFGRVSSNVDVAKATNAEQLANYRKTVRSAFADVMTALANRAHTKTRLDAATKRTAQLAEYFRLAQLRYDAGYTDYLDVLDAQRNLFTAQLDVVQAQADRIDAVVNLYKALGGGWAGAHPDTDPTWLPVPPILMPDPLESGEAAPAVGDDPLTP